MAPVGICHWGAKRQAFAAVSNDIAGAGNRTNNHVVNRHQGSASCDNHIKEVINGNNNHPAFPDLTGRLLKPADRQ